MIVTINVIIIPFCEIIIPSNAMNLRLIHFYRVTRKLLRIRITAAMNLRVP